MQEAAEHRRRKAQLAEGQQEEHPPEKLLEKQSLRSPAHGTAAIPWWPGERIIGGGPWSKLPRWQPFLDSQTPSEYSAVKPKRMQAPRGLKGRYHRQGAAIEATPRQDERQSSQQGSKHPQQLRRPHTAPSLLQEPAQAVQTSSQSPSHATCPHKHIDEVSLSQGTQHPSTQYPPLQPTRYPRRPTQQRRPVATHVAGQEAGRVVYVRRSSSQQQPKRAGRVPNFRELHAKWDARLAAAKASVHRHLTVPKVRATVGCSCNALLEHSQ